MEPWQSWGIVVIVGVGVYVYYSQSNAKHGRGRLALVPEQVQRRLREDSKARRKRGDNPGASDQINSDIAVVSSASGVNNKKDRMKKRKGEKKQPSQLAQSFAVETGQNDQGELNTSDAEEDDIDNKEFARLLSGVKTGTSLGMPADANEPKRVGKEGKRNELEPVSANGTVGMVNGLPSDKGLSASSSTTGADADDDLSPAASPAFGATHSARAAGDLSDMLEAPTKGPLVLRVTEPEQPQVVRQPKPQKKVEEPETKKQRQNRKRNEEKKAAQEEAEKERRVLLEKQLRTAREAEGRPAKNGLGSLKPPVSNVWTKSSDEAALLAPSAAPEPKTSLLDTFDGTNNVAGGSHEEKVTSTKDKMWEHDLPSESEQLRILNEMEGNDGWNTVEKSGKAKKKGVNHSEKTGEIDRVLTTNGKSTVNHFDAYQSSGQETPTAKGKITVSSRPRSLKEKVDPAIWNRGNIHNHPDYDPEYPYALTGHPDDSDWAVV